MLTPETQPDHYTERPETALPVWYWPAGQVDHNGTPLVGFVHKGWDLGMADINALPNGDGTVAFFDGAFHIGDRRVFDHYGNISSAARRKGVWEPAPFMRDYIAKRIKAQGLESKKKAAE